MTHSVTYRWLPEWFLLRRWTTVIQGCTKTCAHLVAKKAHWYLLIPHGRRRGNDNSLIPWRWAIFHDWRRCWWCISEETNIYLPGSPLQAEEESCGGAFSSMASCGSLRHTFLTVEPMEHDLLGSHALDGPVNRLGLLAGSITPSPCLVGRSLGVEFNIA